MPYKSLAQEGYFHTHKRQLEKEGVNVGEWDRATKGKKLPWHAKKHVDKTRKNKFSSMNNRVIRLHQINDKLEICFARPQDDEDENIPYGKLAVGAAGLGAGGYGAYKLNNTIHARQTAMNISPMAPTSYVDAAKNIGSDVVKNAANYGTAKLAGLKDLLLRGKNALLKRAGAALSSRHGNLIELNSKLGEVIGNIKGS